MAKSPEMLAHPRRRWGYRNSELDQLERVKFVGDREAERPPTAQGSGLAK